MELTFVHQYSGDVPKRRRLAKACESCRARKKRCVHFTEENGDDENGDAHDKSPSQNGTAERTPADSNTTQESPPDPRHSWRRFVSDMTPESLFLNRPKLSKKDSQTRPGDDIGLWVDRREWDALVRQRDGAIAVNTSRQRPHPTVIGPLIDVYFRKIHPILPLLDEDQFRRDHRNGTVPELLVHALCLVSAKDPEAFPHLRMNQSASILSPREFGSRMHDTVKNALKATCRFDKFTLIRILALASLHNEAPDGAEEASMCLSQAMHHAQTMGIHLGQHSESTSQQEHSMKRLFWCLWILDRLNSAIHGRPLVMADIDIAINPIEPGETNFPAFEASLKITELLNQTIAFYRPRVPLDVTGWEEVFPDFEHIIDVVTGWSLPQPTLATLHIFYLSVAVLSHRCHGIKQINRGTHSSIRQRLCASEIVRVMQSPHSKTLHALPVVPYAASLALSVSYQHLRQSQLAHQQEDACNDFRACTEILQTLKRIWCSVDTIVALATRVQGELDRATDLAIFRLPRKGQTEILHESGSVVVDRLLDDAIHPPTACAGTDHLDRLEAEKLSAQEESRKAAAAQAALDQQVQQQAGIDLFDGMDDVFGTYLDPNYPIHLDDLTFLEELPKLGMGEFPGREGLPAT